MFGSNNPIVLYIEDDYTLLELFTERMKVENFEVIAVNKFDLALQKLQEITPDLILCDLMMPGLDGYEVIRKLRENPATSRTKIAVTSALSQPEDIQKAKDLGADDYIIKSQVPIDEIMVRLRKLLELPPLSA